MSYDPKKAAQNLDAITMAHDVKAIKTLIEERDDSQHALRLLQRDDEDGAEFAHVAILRADLAAEREKRERAEAEAKVLGDRLEDVTRLYLDEEEQNALLAELAVLRRVAEAAEEFSDAFSFRNDQGGMDVRKRQKELQAAIDAIDGVRAGRK